MPRRPSFTAANIGTRDKLISRNDFIGVKTAYPFDLMLPLSTCQLSACRAVQVQYVFVGYLIVPRCELFYDFVAHLRGARGRLLDGLRVMGLFEFFSVGGDNIRLQLIIPDPFG